MQPLLLAWLSYTVASLPQANAIRRFSAQPLFLLFLFLSMLLSILLSMPMMVFATVKDDIGFTALQSQLGAALPDGQGVQVFHVEGGTNWIADASDSEFVGKSIISYSLIPSPAVSGHATAVGKAFYGLSSSLAPGVTNIAAHSFNSWLTRQLLFYSPVSPTPISQRVANHSWVSIGVLDASGDFSPANTSTMLRLSDWLSDIDELVQVYAMNNAVDENSGVTRPLMVDAYNGINVGVTSAAHTNTLADIDAIYHAGRAAVHLVVPQPNTSMATPYVSSAAALLVDAANDNPAWSESSTSNRQGSVIYNAGRVETIKAALMAGAARRTSNSQSLGDITDYRVALINQTANGLDRRYGAGQLDISKSYEILAAGEHANELDGGAPDIGFNGFDHDQNFGGANGSNPIAIYRLGKTAQQLDLSVSLVWHLRVNGGQPFDPTATHRRLVLALVEDAEGTVVAFAESNSVNDNTQNIFFELDAEKGYTLYVVPNADQEAFDIDYSLAWATRPALIQDADADGLLDAIESFSRDIDLDGKVDYLDSDSDGNGISDAVEAGDLAAPVDLDMDGIPDYTDPDNDGDGLSDIEEIGTGPTPADINNNGVADYLEAAMPMIPEASVPIPLPAHVLFSLILLLVGITKKRCAA